MNEWFKGCVCPVQARRTITVFLFVRLYSSPLSRVVVVDQSIIPECLNLCPRVLTVSCAERPCYTDLTEAHC